MECYADFKKMSALTMNELDKVKVGEKYYYCNGNDELNTQLFDCHGKVRICKVLYEAEVVAVNKHNIVMLCTPVIGSIYGWPIGTEIKSHIESISKYDGCEKAEQWLYRTIEWVLVKGEEE